jgi:hypothetical protein
LPDKSVFVCSLFSALEDIGNVPTDLLQQIFAVCSPEQLHRIETTSVFVISSFLFSLFFRLVMYVVWFSFRINFLLIEAEERFEHRKVLGTPLHANGYQRKTSQSIDSNHSKIQIQI